MNNEQRKARTTERHRIARMNRIERLENGEVDDIPHGTADCYVNWGCKCPDCTEAQKLKMRDYRARRKR